MKNKFNKLVGLFLTCSILFWSCENVDFGDENVNPNAVSTPNTGALLTNVLRNIPGMVSGVNNTLLAQHVSEVTYTEDSRYENVQWNFDSYYTGPLMDLNTIIGLVGDNPSEYASSGSSGMQIGVAHILRSYIITFMADHWGMIPFSEANQGVNNLTPKFDTMEAIYTKAFADIDAGMALLDGGGLTGDFMFSGSVAQWKMFGNTLKMTMALRIADISSSVAKSNFEAAWNAGVVATVSDNIHYPYLSSDDNDNPWQDRFETREDYASSDILLNHMVAHSDPRIHKFFEPVATKNSAYENRDPADGPSVVYHEVDGLTYAGMPYGYDTPGILQTAVSFITDSVIYDGTQAGGMLYTYAQVCFNMAEASVRGWNVPGDAQTWYELGMQASMDQWGVSSADATAYVDAAPAATMETIGNEKWIALYLQGFEAWAEQRRLDYPVLSAAPDAITGNGIPNRYGYGANTATNNSSNYNAAVAAQGADNQDTRLWWDTK
jgi:hypothetical protein